MWSTPCGQSELISNLFSLFVFFSICPVPTNLCLKGDGEWPASDKGVVDGEKFKGLGDNEVFKFFRVLEEDGVVDLDK